MSDGRDRPERRFPLGKHHRGDIRTRSGEALSDITLDRVLAGDVDPNAAAVSAETLQTQAGFAAEAGYHSVAENLARAAEMTRIPDTEILEIYESLRPGRSTYFQLLSLSQRVASMYAAERTAAYIREAADVYRDTGLLKVDDA